MTTVHKIGGWEIPGFGEIPHRPISSQNGNGEAPYVAFTKGAVDSLLKVCNRVLVGTEVEPLNDSWRERILKANNEQAENGVRVLGVAGRAWEDVPHKTDQEALEIELIFIGMIGMIDPARPEVKDAVNTCKTAGIRPVMITGDHPLTARYIAEELGISTNGKILTGEELGKMSAGELERYVDEVSVYARVSPEHKLNIVQALQKHGQIVAMTGDGVNDAPALE
jgi:P-type Ca2+ transporter type 2C